ncbi:MAG TPA: MmgE/PrpD family protein [Acidobacteriaceae bacterium]|nr:MmgE/PrpD family protein [Acidobacteriaceae bacterium]
MAYVVERLAALAQEFNFDAMPTDVVDKAKILLLDSLGCALGGFTSKPAKIIRSVVRTMGGNGEATLLVSGERSSALGTTWVNGTAIRYLDYNDTYFARDPSHPSGNVAPGLALAERQGLSGREFIAALALAYEVQIRLSECAGKPNLWNRGWDHATNVPYAAAALSAKLLGLSTEQTAHALAIAGSQSNALSEIRRGVIPMTKAIAEAKAAGDGVLAALMAREGMTGPLRIFEGDYGYINIIASEVDVEALTAPLSDYKILKSTVKNYAIETMTLGPVDAALELRREHRFDPLQIDKVVVGLYEYAFKKPSWDKLKLTPTTRETADHSFNYCVAVALLDGNVGPEQFTDERIRSADVRDLMSRVDLTVDSALEGLYPSTFPGITTIHMRDGRVLTKRIDYPRGHPRNPMSRARLEEKFRLMAQEWMTPAAIDSAIAAVWAFDTVNDIREFMQLFVSTRAQ